MQISKGYFSFITAPMRGKTRQVIATQCSIPGQGTRAPYCIVFHTNIIRIGVTVLDTVEFRRAVKVHLNRREGIAPPPEPIAADELAY